MSVFPCGKSGSSNDMKDWAGLVMALSSGGINSAFGVDCSESRSSPVAFAEARLVSTDRTSRKEDCVSGGDFSESFMVSLSSSSEELRDVLWLGGRAGRGSSGSIC